MSGGGNGGAFDAMVARLTARLERRLADRRLSRRPAAGAALTRDSWRSAEMLWPDFAPALQRRTKE